MKREPSGIKKYQNLKCNDPAEKEKWSFSLYIFGIFRTQCFYLLAGAHGQLGDDLVVS